MPQEPTALSLWLQTFGPETWVSLAAAVVSVGGALATVIAALVARKAARQHAIETETMKLRSAVVIRRLEEFDNAARELMDAAYAADGPRAELEKLSRRLAAYAVLVPDERDRRCVTSYSGNLLDTLYGDQGKGGGGEAAGAETRLGAAVVALRMAVDWSAERRLQRTALPETSCKEPQSARNLRDMT